VHSQSMILVDFVKYQGPVTYCEQLPLHAHAVDVQKVKCLALRVHPRTLSA
jgi:hypothetical protein